MPAEPRRAILLRRPDADGRDIEQITQQHGLTVVYTITTDTEVPRLAVMMAVQRVLEHGTVAVVVPHLTAEDIRTGREWRALAELVDVVISGGETYFART